jgi:hypothetical protein
VQPWPAEPDGFTPATLAEILRLALATQRAHADVECTLMPMTERYRTAMTDPSRRGPVSAADVVADRERRLREDPEYRAAVEQADAERAALAEERELACLPVVDDLRSVGVEVESLWLLYEQPEAYPVAIPVLLAHLERDYTERTLEDIGHALPFKPATTWWEDFKGLYLRTKSDAVRDRLGAAMSQCAVRQHYGDLLRFIGDSSLGPSRIYFLRPINRIGNRMEPGRGRAVIQSVADDETLGVEATRILQGRSRSQ